MINPQLLTPEFGFVDGVVVEVDWNGYETEYRAFHGGMIHLAEAINSIHPLTGPLSIWLHAPAKASHCLRCHDGDILWFDEKDEPEGLGEVIATLKDEGVWSVRPWWCK